MTWPPAGTEVGSPMSPLERRLALPALVAYGGATWDWHRLHYDRDYAAARGQPAPVVDGQMLGALLVEALQDWLGPGAFVRRLAFRFRRPVLADETVRCEGKVVGLSGGVVFADLRIVVLGDDPPVVAVAPASAEVQERA